MSNMTRVAVLDDWQGVARGAADWSPLQARAEVVFFADAFADEDDAAAKLADFEIVLSMRERTPLPGSLINRLPKLRMLGMTGRAQCLAGYAGLHGAGHSGVQHARRRLCRFGDGGTGAGAADLRRRAAWRSGDAKIRGGRLPDGRAGGDRAGRQDDRHRSGWAGWAATWRPTARRCA